MGTGVMLARLIVPTRTSPSVMSSSPRQTFCSKTMEARPSDFTRVLTTRSSSSFAARR